MKKIQLGRTGEQIPILGQGTWGIKVSGKKAHYEKWKQSLRRGIELGMTHMDTAEIYGAGTSERIVGEIIKEYDRDDLFITSKLFPIHLGFKAMKKACLKSLKRLGIGNLDLYLIHFPSFIIPKIEKHMRLMEELLNEGKTRYIGVSNFSVKQFKKGQQSLKKTELVTNQLQASVSIQRHIHNSLPYYQKEGITLTAYSPLGHRGYYTLGGELRSKLEQLGATHNSTIQQIAIAWLINHKNVISIPKAIQIEHIEANAKATEITLSQEELSLLYNT
ncbi:MAG: aldo/keto reductase [Candidatus Thorarchaeota archaeon]